MTLTYPSFIEAVQDVARLPSDAADRAARATLETLSERISRGEAEDVAEQLPNELRPALLADAGEAEPFGADEFLRRLAQREGADEQTARQHARAVFEALRRAVEPKEIADLMAQLPRDLRALLDGEDGDGDVRTARRSPSAEAFYRLVAAHADIVGMDEARRATDAALEALGDRITGGEADKLGALLPPELAEALERGKAKSSGAARPLSLEEFLTEIAELEGTDTETARRHAEAVFAVLRAHVGNAAMRGVFDQVPDTYAVLLGPRP